ncbi:hypothetical protein Y1Q_0002418 [Alligator mississippiensis]|uniref:Uncharacterized protein n=1 Tax=Alligator mississippiensis TaxID=8496 RepID=A0A151N6D2_ALLMI|nr:hypothetical protein Y1Q_0002418 [Alligator mississippiensis]
MSRMMSTEDLKGLLQDLRLHEAKHHHTAAGKVQLNQPHSPNTTKVTIPYLEFLTKFTRIARSASMQRKFLRI